ncbi:hypothetical protein ACROYT_G041588 [Oculina patagonica]
MPNWYFSKEDLLRTPSRLDGIDYMTEMRYRREGTRFIMNCGNRMRLRYDTMATGAVYFHRFYMVQSFKNFPRWVTGAACLFLAGKVEETPKKCRDIIKTAKIILFENQFEVFGDDPKEEVMTYERVLLQTIKFDLQVEHPYPSLLKFGKALKGDRAKMNKLVQMAWTFSNDSLSTTLCLRHKPEVISVAMIALAAKFNNHDLQASSAAPGKTWFHSFIKGVKESVIEDICDEMYELYGGGKKKEKTEASDEGSSSNHSSPMTSLSPPTKKRKHTSTSSEIKSQTLASDTPPVPSQMSAEPLKPLPPSLTSSQIQVENVSPAPIPLQQQQPLTVTTEPPKVTQTVDTTFASAQTGKTTSDMPAVASANVLQPTLTSYSAVTSSYSAEQNYAMNIYQQTVQPTGVATLTTNASFQPSLGSTTLGSVPPFHLPSQFQNQSYLPPTQGYAHFTGLGGFPNAPPPPLPPIPTSALYPPPPSGVNTLQNPSGYGVPPHQGRPPHPPMSLPPPPLPPLHSGQRPPLPQVASNDFQWPRQFGVPPSQNQQMGGWMR